MLMDPAYIDPRSGRTWPLSVPRRQRHRRTRTR
jgi:hypothetical protein